MSDKIAVVTGSNKGLGFAIVQELCQLNYGIVYLTSRDQARGIQACQILEKKELKPAFRTLEVTNEASVDAFVKYIKEKHEKIDLLINNAGVLFLKDAVEPIDVQAEETLKVNFFSLVNFTEKMLPVMKNGASILNISSSSGHLSRIPSGGLRKKLQDNMDVEQLKTLIGCYLDDVRRGNVDDWGDSPYVVSKVGVNAYGFLLQRRLQNQGILVNSYHPGYVISDMTRGVGTVTPEQAAMGAVKVALGGTGGQYIWHDGTPVPWDGPDPRVYIDGKS